MTPDDATVLWSLIIACLVAIVPMALLAMREEEARQQAEEEYLRSSAHKGLHDEPCDTCGAPAGVRCSDKK